MLANADIIRLGLHAGDKDWKDTHVGSVLPERAPSEGCEGAGNHPSCSQSPHDTAVVAQCAQ